MTCIVPEYITNRCHPDQSDLNFLRETGYLMSIRGAFQKLTNSNLVPQSPNFVLYKVCSSLLDEDRKRLEEEKFKLLNGKVEKIRDDVVETQRKVVAKMKQYNEMMNNTAEDKRKGLILIMNNLKTLTEVTDLYERYMEASEKLLYIKELMQATVDTYELYSDFFESVVDTSERYGHIEDLSYRYSKTWKLRESMLEDANKINEETIALRDEWNEEAKKDIEEVLNLIVKLQQVNARAYHTKVKLLDEEKMYLAKQKQLDKKQDEVAEMGFTMKNLLQWLQTIRNLDPAIEYRLYREQIKAIRKEYFQNKEILRRWEYLNEQTNLDNEKMHG